MTRSQRAAYQADKGLGHLYTAFPDHKDGLEACAAVEALIEISAIETLRSAFLLPLQGDAVSAEVRTLHCPTSACVQAQSRVTRGGVLISRPAAMGAG